MTNLIVNIAKLGAGMMIFSGCIMLLVTLAFVAYVICSGLFGAIMAGG